MLPHVEIALSQSSWKQGRPLTVCWPCLLPLNDVVRLGLAVFVRFELLCQPLGDHVGHGLHGDHGVDPRAGGEDGCVRHI